MKEAQSDMDSATSMLEKADSKKDKLEATAKVLGRVDKNRFGCFGAPPWGPKTKGMVRILGQAFVRGLGDWGSVWFRHVRKQRCCQVKKAAARLQAAMFVSKK